MTSPFPNRTLPRGSKLIGTTLMVSDNVVKIDQNNPEPSLITKAYRVLSRGGLVVGPTETRYGLLAKVDLPKAVERLFEIKGRSIEKPSAIFVEDISKLKELADVTPSAQLLAGKFLPGPLTLVLRSKRDFGQFFTLNNRTGFRISSSPFIKFLVERTGALSATSANLSGHKEPNLISEIQEQLGDKIDLYIDAGKLDNPVSTVVQVVNDGVTMLREGAISSKDIFAVVK